MTTPAAAVQIEQLKRGESQLQAPAAFYLIDWNAPTDESEWPHLRVLALFDTHGFRNWAPERRHKSTAGVRALAKKTGAKKNNLHYVGDMVSVPVGKRIPRSRDAIGADVRFNRKAVVRIEAGGEVITTKDFDYVFRPEYVRQQDLVTGHDIKKRWSDLILGELNAYRWRPGAFFLQNEDPYVTGMWRLVELAKEFGASMSTIPIHNEGNNHRIVAERALDSMQKDFRDLDVDLDELLGRMGGEKFKGFRDDTLAKYLTKVGAMEQKLGFVIDKVGDELEDLQTIGQKRLAEIKKKFRQLRDAGEEE